MVSGFCALAPDFSSPLVLPGCSSAPGTTPTESLSEEHLATIVSMGFSRDQATKALKATVSKGLGLASVDRDVPF